MEPWSAGLPWCNGYHDVDGGVVVDNLVYMKLRPMEWDNARGAPESFFALSEEGKTKVYLSIELQCQGSYVPPPPQTGRLVFCFFGILYFVRKSSIIQSCQLERIPQDPRYVLTLLRFLAMSLLRGRHPALEIQWAMSQKPG